MEWRQARSATGLLRTFTDAEVLESSDVHVAQRLTALATKSDETVALAVALVVRALRNGSVCVDLRSVEQQVGIEGLPWPDVDAWLAAMRCEPAGRLAAGAARRRGSAVSRPVLARGAAGVPRRARDDRGRARSRCLPDIDRLFPAGYEEQRAAAEVALSQGLTVLTGGPGTGKTTTVARLLGVAGGSGDAALRIALAAPTGKAAARLQEAVQLEVGKLDAPTGRRCRGCMRRRCTGCSAAGRTRRRGSATTAEIGCRTT